MRFWSIVVALDSHPDAERALPVATALTAASGLPIELIGVVAPDESELACRSELDQHIAHLGLDRVTTYVLHADDASLAIVDHVANRDGALLVIATSGRGAPGDGRLGKVMEAILGRLCQPILVVGPLAGGRATRLVLVIDGTRIADVAVPVVAAWAHTFRTRPPCVVEVTPPDGWPADAPAPSDRRVAAYVSGLGDRGVGARGEVLRGRDAAATLVEYAQRVGDAVLVLTSPRWEGDPSHWFTTTRQVIRRARTPVLVVPTDLSQR